MGFERNRVKSLVFVVSDKYFIDHESGSRSIYICAGTPNMPKEFDNMVLIVNG